MSNIRQNIKNYLSLSCRVEKALTEYFKGNKEKNVIAQEYFSSAEDFQELCNIFEKKITIIEGKIEYLEKKENYENAVKDVFDGILDIPGAVEKYKYVTEKELRLQYQMFLDLKMWGAEYKYSKSILDKDAITFEAEIYILKDLNNWRIYSSCPCRICALEYMFNRARNLTKNLDKQANEQWLYEFETRHSENFSSLLFTCKKDSLPSMSASQFSSSFNITNISKSSTLSGHQTIEEIELESNPVDIQKLIEDHKMFDIRQRIKNFLNLSNRFVPPAEEYLLTVRKKLKIVTEKYNIDSDEGHRILRDVIFILNKNIKYKKDKSNIEQAVNLVVNRNVPIKDAALSCQISVFFLKMELKEYRILLRKSSKELKYTYDIVIPTLEYYLNVKYNVENSYLEQLHKWKETSQSLCTCQICALEQLYKHITNTIDEYRTMDRIKFQKKKTNIN